MGLKVTLGESIVSLVFGVLCALLSPIIAFIGSPLTLISEVAIQTIILFFGLAIAVNAVMDKFRVVRWRREYEASIDRLIRVTYGAV